MLIDFRSLWIYILFTFGTLMDKIEHKWNTDYKRLAKNGLFVHPLETCEKDQNITKKFWLHWHSMVLIDFRSPWIYIPFTCGTHINKVEKHIILIIRNLQEMDVNGKLFGKHLKRIKTILKSFDFIGIAWCLLISGPHGLLQLWSWNICFVF